MQGLLLPAALNFKEIQATQPSWKPKKTAAKDFLA
jgi:hypothetical protein